MTLAELLDNEDTPNAVEESSKSIPKYIPDGDVDKLASAIEEFADKLENALEKFDTLTSKDKLAAKYPPRPGSIDKEIRKIEKGIKGQRKLLDLERKQKLYEALREGKTWRSHPWVVPAVLGAMGGAYLWDAATKSPQYMRVS